MIVTGDTNLKRTDIGLIPENWDVVPFDQTISHVVDNRGRTAPTSETGIPLIATNCIKEDGLFPAKENLRYVSKKTFDSWFRDHPRPNDIIIVNKGTPGMVCLVPDPVDFCFAQDMVSVRPNEDKIYGRFLFAFMRSRQFKHEVDSLNVGTTVPHLKKTYFPMLMIPLPPRHEQRVIGDTYYNLSLRIELCRQMTKTLESIGKAIFRHWFVDLEFPGKEGKPYESSGGEMIYNEVIDDYIPRDWQTKPIDEIANFLNGLALQNYPPENVMEFLPVIKIRELRQSVSESTDRASTNIPKQYIVDNGDVLFSWSGSLEVMIWTSGKGALNQHLFKVTSTSFPKWFYYYWTLHYLPEYRRIAEGKATTMGHIQRHHLKSSLVLVPDSTTLQRMDKVLSPIIQKLIELGIESWQLSQIRDGLLPKLISGQIRVPE